MFARAIYGWGNIVGLTVQPVQAWKNERYKLFDWLIDTSLFVMIVYRFLPYIGVLAAAKFFRSFGIFLSYDILKLIHVVPFLFLIKAG